MRTDLVKDLLKWRKQHEEECDALIGNDIESLQKLTNREIEDILSSGSRFAVAKLYFYLNQDNLSINLKSALHSYIKYDGKHIDKIVKMMHNESFRTLKEESALSVLYFVSKLEHRDTANFVTKTVMSLDEDTLQKEDVFNLVRKMAINYELDRDKRLEENNSSFSELSSSPKETVKVKTKLVKLN